MREQLRGWRYITMLAHEIGHALDHHKQHPAQHMLRSPRGRYREELAAVSFEFAFMRQLGLDKTKRGRRWMIVAQEYLYRYKQGKHPTLTEVEIAMMRYRVPDLPSEVEGP